MAEHLLKNRMQAGIALAERLHAYAGHADAIVLALPRGGVPVGFGIAETLQLPLDILPVRKIGVPGYEEFAMGAIASGGQRVFKPAVIAMFGIDQRVIDTVVQRELLELERRENLYRANRALLQLEGRTVMLVDDGLATGCTMLAAIAAVREQHPARVIVAVPVGAQDTCAKLRTEADELVCLKTPELFHSVSLWYDDFTQVTDDEVKSLLGRADRRALAQKADSGGIVMQERKNNDRTHPFR
jgi:putative phosphoribosyl transferase